MHYLSCHQHLNSSREPLYLLSWISVMPNTSSASGKGTSGRWLLTPLLDITVILLSYISWTMPFGLTNVPTVVQALVNNVLRDILNWYVIFSCSLEEQVTHVRTVLQRLLQNEDCESRKVWFPCPNHHLPGVQTLGWEHADGPRPDKSGQGLWSFLHPFKWTLEAGNTFKRLKDLFTSAPILTLPDPPQQIVVEVGTSNLGVQSILSQRDPKGSHLHPCTAFSRCLRQSERNYTVGDRDLLAITLHWKSGIIGWKGPSSRFWYRLTTRIWNTSEQPRGSTPDCLSLGFAFYVPMIPLHGPATWCELIIPTPCRLLPSVYLFFKQPMATNHHCSPPRI